MEHEPLQYKDEHVVIAMYAVLKSLIEQLHEAGNLSSEQTQALFQRAQQRLEAQSNPHALAAALLVEAWRPARGG